MSFKRTALLTVLAFSLALGLMVFVNKKASAAILIVDDGGPVTCAGATFVTIQSAVNAASPGDTIQVCAGTYNEDVTIPATLTGLSLKGAQAGVPVTGRTFGSPTESTVNGTISISAPNVTVDGFSQTKSVLTFAVFGIVVKAGADNAVITNNIIDTITSADTGSNGTAQAIYLENGGASDGADNVSITDNRINNVHSNRSAKGVLIGVNGATNPSQNTLIEGNSITNITSDTRGAYGVSVANTPGVSGLVVRDNILDNLVGTLGWSHAIGLEGDTPNVLVQGNCISNVIAPGTDRIAVWFESNPSFSTAQVHQNNLDVTIAAFGIAVHPSLVTANPTGSVNGENNWWGSASGPGPVGPGAGAMVSPGVDYTPWLIAPALGGACGGEEVTTKDQCKNGGWQNFFRANGTSFKNQGDCIQYVNTGK